MNKTKTKAPLISGSYYKELLRELRTIGIIFGCLQLLVGFFGEFTGNASMLLFGSGAGSGGISLYIIFFIACGLNFATRHVAGRGSWDFRGSLPLAKRTMVATHFLATLTYAAIVFIANYIGVLFGEIILRIPGVDTRIIPVGFGGAALDLAWSLLRGLSIYALIITLFSVVVNGFSIAASVVVAVWLPTWFMSLAARLSSGKSLLSELIFPLSGSASSALGWITQLAFTLVTLVLAYIAASNARAETGGKPARAPWIHVLIGLAVALLAGLFGAMVGLTGTLDEYANGGAATWLLPAIVCAILMLVAYTGYMWITLRSFKKAAKRIMFLPIAFIALAFTAVIASVANRQQESLKVALRDAEYVTIDPAGFYGSNGSSVIDYLITGGVNRGSTGAEKIKFTDDVLRASAQAAAKQKLEMQENMFYDDPFIAGILNMSGISNGFYSRELHLKDGRVVCVNMGDTDTWRVFENDEYVRCMTSMDRFKHGRVFSPNWLGSEFSKTLFEEIETLSPRDRLELFTSAGVWTYGTVTIVSPTYDHAATIRITDKLPRSAKLYMEKSNERLMNDKNYNRVVEGLKGNSYSIANIELAAKPGSSNNVEYASIMYDKDLYNGFTANDRQTVLDAIRLVGTLLEKDTRLENAAYILKLDVQSYYEDRSSPDRDMLNLNSMYLGGYTVFVALNDAEYAELSEKILNNQQLERIFKTYFGGWEDYPDEVDFTNPFELP